MRAILRGFAFGAAVLISLPAVAATLDVVQGSVSVKRESGFQGVSGTVHVINGDVVRAGPGGVAEIVYEDGCRVTVDPGTVETIGDVRHCRFGRFVSKVAVKAAVVGGVVLLVYSLAK